MRLVLAAAISFSVAAAHAESRPQPPARTQVTATQVAAARQQPVMHYRTLEKMLRRFSSVAGEARTRG
jgi:hypothetical protein